MEWYVSVRLEVEVGDDEQAKWIILRRHHAESLGPYVRDMFPNLPPDAMVSVCVQPYETDGRHLRSHSYSVRPGDPIGPSAGFLVSARDLDTLEYKVSQSVK
jgi:hypothetical protein